MPVYLTKWRVKKPDSVYLKTKRKDEDYKKFTDFGGLRLLCLFEQDIVNVYEYFLFVLSDNGYQLHECFAYNWDDKSDLFFVLNKMTEKYFSGYSLRAEKKSSGYKSIHCLVVKDGLVVEVQLRTLVQDVWSELEHTLSYKKGSVHPHIKKSFSLLSKDLQNIDDLFSHLKDISDKEKGGEAFSNYKVGPKCRFEYENDLIPLIFRETGAISELYNNYWEIISAQKVIDIDKPWVIELRICFEKLKESVREVDIDFQKKYWFDMEEAFLMFCERRYDDAMSKYKNIENYAKDRYCVYYRLGELHFINEDNEIALNYFDKSELLLEKSDKNNCYNHFLIKSRLALTYWSLGDEYIDIAIREALAAKEIYDQSFTNDPFSERDLLIITNSLCWYYLERYVIAKRAGDKRVLDGYFTDVKLRFEDLEKIVDNKPDVSVGVLDTSMWYYYYKYKRTKNEVDLKKAKSYALMMKGKINNNSSFRIMNMHINHIQEVMQYSQDVLGGDEIREIVNG